MTIYIGSDGEEILMAGGGQKDFFGLTEVIVGPKVEASPKPTEPPEVAGALSPDQVCLYTQGGGGGNEHSQPHSIK